jgi:hypothetical protein
MAEEELEERNFLNWLSSYREGAQSLQAVGQEIVAVDESSPCPFLAVKGGEEEGQDFLLYFPGS